MSKALDKVWYRCVVPRESKARRIVTQATSWQAPPASLILFSAVLENSLARTRQGMEASSPFPRTLVQPCLTRLLFIRFLTYSFGSIDHSSLVGSGVLAGVLGNKSPEFVEVDYLSVESVLMLIEMSDSPLSIVPRVTRQRSAVSRQHAKTYYFSIMILS